MLVKFQNLVSNEMGKLEAIDFYKQCVPYTHLSDLESYWLEN